MIQSKRLLEEFKRLVAFDAQSYEERDIADYLKKRLAELGLSVQEDTAGSRLHSEEGGNPEKAAGNLYACLPAERWETDTPILLSAHMDTVKPGRGKRAVEHLDGRITSDGATVLGADDAAGLAEILEVLQVLQEERLPHPTIEILFPVAEEPYAQGSGCFDYQKLTARQAYVLDLSGPVGRAAIAAPTILAVQIRISGRAAHAGFCPEEGVHAIWIAAKAIAQLPSGRTPRGTTVNLGTIQGGTGRNIVPEACVVTGEIRGLDHADAIRQAEEIKRVFTETAQAAGGQAEVVIREEIHAYRIPEDAPVVRRFRRACQALGLSGELEETLGGSDNNHFCQHGIQGIVIANAMNQVHSTQEYTSVSELTRAAELTLRLVTEP